MLILIYTILLGIFLQVKSFAFFEYPEYKIEPLPSRVNKIYLQDSLRYLALTSDAENVIESAFSVDSQIQYKLLTFPDNAVRVLMVYDSRKNTQSINIINLKHGQFLYDSLKFFKQRIVKNEFINIPITRYHNEVYNNIRQEIINNIIQGSIIQINTLGITSAYGTMLAIELTQLQNPIQSILQFGATRFTTQSVHNYIQGKFKNIMLNITHEMDINHQLSMNSSIATSLEEYIICVSKMCHETIYEQKTFSKNAILTHISAFPHQYAEMYHDSLIQ